MITKLTLKENIQIAEFKDLKRFTLAVAEEVKSDLKPLLAQKGEKMILDFTNIDFIDSSGIGCVISLIKTAKNAGSEIKLCNLSKEVMDIFELLHLQLIIEIEKDRESCIKSFF